MKQSKFGYFLKLIFVFLLALAGFLSLLKETILSTKQAQTLATVDVLGQKTQSPNIFAESIKNEITPAVFLASNDFTVRVPILMYHYVRVGVPISETISYTLSVTPEQLDTQLQYIQQNGYQTISLNDLYDALENKIPLPPKSVILTFDDGYRDFYTDAFPLLKKYNLRAVSFYIAGYLNYPTYMNLKMLKEIHNSGLVDIESHTVGHLMLTKLTPEQAKTEIFESKKILEQSLRKKVNYFAYPYGDLNESIVTLVKDAGYKLGFSTRVGSDQHQSEKYYLKRITVSGYDSFDTFKTKLDNW